jgi:hypothetical protein
MQTSAKMRFVKRSISSIAFRNVAVTPLSLTILLFVVGRVAGQDRPANFPSDTELAEAQKVFTAILKDDEKAQKHVYLVAGYTLHSPFRFSSLISMTQRLAVADFPVADIDEALLPSGDMAIAAGGSLAEQESRLSAIVGVLMRMQVGRDKVSTCLDVLEQNDVPAYVYIAEATGRSVEWVRKMADDDRMRGDVTKRLLLDAFRRKFSGLAEKVGNSKPEIRN